MPDDDDTTLFICSGMQRVRQHFQNPLGGRHGSLQSCIRMDDIELVGDGTHLTYFEMVGNFSFGGDEYDLSVELWCSILDDLRIRNVVVHVHPTQLEHERLWQSRGFSTIHDDSCTWSDGRIGGFCCELFVDGLEIGNLVNPLGHSTDVGFGWERIHQVIERKPRINETSLFQQGLHPVVSDHLRTILVLWENGVVPGNKGRNYVCRRLIRRLLRFECDFKQQPFNEWIEQERSRKEECIRNGRRYWRKHRDKPQEFWWETFGVLPEEIPLLSE